MENLFVLNKEEKVICIFDSFGEFKRSVLKYIISFLVSEEIYSDEKKAGIHELENFKLLFTTSKEVTIGNKKWKKIEIKKNYISNNNKTVYKTKFTKLKIVGHHLNIKSLDDPLPFVSLDSFC